jgi:hypothetical protein
VLVGAHAGRAARKEAAILTLKNLISADDDNDVARRRGKTAAHQVRDWLLAVAGRGGTGSALLLAVAPIVASFHLRCFPSLNGLKPTTNSQMSYFYSVWAADGAARLQHPNHTSNTNCSAATTLMVHFCRSTVRFGHTLRVPLAFSWCKSSGGQFHSHPVLRIHKTVRNYMPQSRKHGIFGKQSTISDRIMM